MAYISIVNYTLQLQFLQVLTCPQKEAFKTPLYNSKVEVKFVLQISRPPSNGASLDRFLTGSTEFATESQTPKGTQYTGG